MIQTVANFFWGWGGLGAIVATGALFFASVSPVFKREALYLAAVAFTATFIYGKGYADGTAVVQAQWHKAIAAEIERGEAARRDAERDVDRGVSDGFNRDEH